MRNARPRMVIVGLDGMPFHLIRDLAQSGVMPNTKEIIQDGTFTQMESSIPEISSVAWSSVITGTNPGCHGIFGFTDVSDGTYRLSFPNFSSLKMSPFWNRGKDQASPLPRFLSPARPRWTVARRSRPANGIRRGSAPPGLPG